MTNTDFKTTANGMSVSLEDINFLQPEAFKEALIREGKLGARLTSLFALDCPESVLLIAVIAQDSAGTIALLGCTPGRDMTYPSLTTEWPQAQAFERDLWENHGITPEGHPWLKPLCFSNIPEGKSIPCGYNYFSAEGEEVHEVAVGPVHAGIIEPGHFRFQCHGEEVLHLEIQLGYQHRGVEKILLGAIQSQRLAAAESIAGDSVIAHTAAFAMVDEALSGTAVSARAHALRAIALELERIANHTGDLGALAGDVGYLPAASYFGRLRGDFLNLTQGLCGSRFGRGLVVPGGVRFDAGKKWVEETLKALVVLKRDLEDTANLLFNSASVQGRFEGTGVLHLDKAEALGIVGPAARASGCRRDVRREHPAGYYRFAQIPPQTLATGDVYARAMIRWLEIQQSLRFLEEHLQMIPSGDLISENGPRAPGKIAIAMIEGWRGETVHAAATDEKGALSVYKVTDPSLHNWMGLSMAMRGGAISDFPPCNKSFNLSYAGHDR
jgi:Ni,Fe-hydrogenase III large subunit